MWGSSSGYIGSSSDPSGSITNIAQYIEDYIDLVENIPNDIARHVSRLHEYNNRYYQLLDKLEKTWESITHCSNSILSNGGGSGGNNSDQVNGGGNTSLASSFSSPLPSTTSISSLTSSSSHSLSSSSSKTEIKSSTNIKSNNHTSSSSSTSSTSSSSSTTTAPSSLIIKSNSNFNISHEIGAKSEKISGNATDLLLNCTIDSKKGLKAVVGLQKCLIEIQEISDEKLFIVQSILDQLDFKARQLDYDHRSVTIGSLANNLNGNSSKGLASLIGASSDTTNHVSDANGLINNVDSGGGGKGGGEITSTKDNNNLSSNGTGLSATVNNCTSNTLSSKRSSSRRNLSNKQEISNGEITSNHKRGVKRGSGGVKGSNKDLKRNKSAKEVLNTSPPTLYEDTPIDPDEPTYCSCEQVSYGEMICCDNAQCPIEWFHFACVSLSTKPKGKWYCPNCRGDRSNIPKK